MPSVVKENIKIHEIIKLKKQVTDLSASPSLYK